MARIGENAPHPRRTVRNRHYSVARLGLVYIDIGEAQTDASSRGGEKVLTYISYGETGDSVCYSLNACTRRLSKVSTPPPFFQIS